MRRAGKLGLVMALVLAAAPALAVDVDRIEIHSRLGEPLLAEIPITGASPAELQQLQAQLASPATFARIGLQRPQGVVADLRFEVVRGARPVIRVTSAMPVQDEFLTFLLQVDAPQGRLVREYSLALGAAPSMPAAVEPQLQAPVQAPDATIVRQPDPADALPAPVEPVVQAPEAAAPAIPMDIPIPAPIPAPIPLSADGKRPARAQPAANPPRPATTAATPRAPAPRPATAQPPRAAAPRAAAAPRPPVPRPAPAQSPAAPRPSTPVGTARQPGDYTVRRGDNLTGIVGRMGIDGATVPQAMLAVLRTNPQAFGSGNINLLRQGAVLRAPAATELARLDPAAAEALVRLQTQQWRSGEMPPVAPAEPVAAAPAATVPAASTGVPAPQVAPARLEIAAAAAPSGQQAGASAGGTAASAAQRERAAADLVATRYTEFQEMQQRIAELEQTQKAQQRLLELKERQLSAQRPQRAGLWPWLVAALAVLAALATVWRSRRPQAPGRVTKGLASVLRSEEHPRSSDARS